jgi:1-acyl-sn-glycerol-3-phosphate acyltransferase
MDNRLYRAADTYLPQPERIDKVVHFLGKLNESKVWTSRLETFWQYNLSDLEEPAIITPNHRSNADPLLHGVLIYQNSNRPVVAPGKSNLWKFAAVGKLVESLGAFPVHRNGKTPDEQRRSMMHFLNVAGHAIEHGSHALIYPEGTRKITDEIVIKKRGAALLSLYTGAPIVPIGHIGSEHLFNPLNRSPVMTMFGKPFRPLEEIRQRAPYDEMVDEVNYSIQSHMQEQYNLAQEQFQAIMNK